MNSDHVKLSDIDYEVMSVDLAHILLFKADEIAQAAGMPVAEAFIGTQLDGIVDNFSDLHYTIVPISNFAVSPMFRDALDFIGDPRPSTRMSAEDIGKLKSFMSHVPRVGVNATISRRYPFMTPDGICRIITDAAVARYKLDVSRQGYFSIHELALLAETTDQAVCEDMTEDGGDRLNANRDFTFFRIEYNEAEQWLARQPGFKSSCKDPN